MPYNIKMKYIRPFEYIHRYFNEQDKAYKI